MASAAFLVDGTVTSDTPAEDRAPGRPGLLRTVASFAKAAARTGKGRREEEEEEERLPPPPTPTPSFLKRRSIFRASTLTTAEAISGVSSEGIGALSRSNRMRIGFNAAEEVEVDGIDEVEVGIDADAAVDDAKDRIRVCSCRLLDSALVLALEAERSTCAGAIATIARAPRSRAGVMESFFLFSFEKKKCSLVFTFFPRTTTTSENCALLPPTPNAHAARNRLCRARSGRFRADPLRWTTARGLLPPSSSEQAEPGAH